MPAPVAPVAAPPAPVAAPAAPAPTAVALAPRREVTALTHRVIGSAASAGLVSGIGSPSAVTLETLPDLLPEPGVDDSTPPLRKQPAFIVSLIAAGVILLGVAAFFVLQHVLRGPDAVEGLTVLDGGNNYVLQWNGPDVPYSVSVTTKASTTIDVTRFVKGGRQAFVPKSGLGLTDASCFVVRSTAEATEHPTVPTSRADLSTAGAQRFCVADIPSQ
ncbi:hypothetical protein ASF54_02135 [Frondihabitans sp. Leaf304]|nr:hypothetical protein ASF54_02135 [Frondihabitans sp. Leaf304]